MPGNLKIPLVSTIQEKCRSCYTCVRECPAKAIRISGGKAEVLFERCIGCGNCVRVCNQNAKKVHSSISKVYEMLKGNDKTAACIAPSFPADFPDLDYTVFVGMLRKLGFEYIHEVSFGADLVAKKTVELIQQDNGKNYISTACPSVFGYIRRYQPELMDSLAPIVSPMVATARLMRTIYKDKLNIVFIGPCIAKKAEASAEEIAGDVDTVLTFKELVQMFKERNIESSSVEPSDFDPPYGGKGALFPLSRGMLQAAGIYEDLINKDVVAADGRVNFIESLKEFQSGDIDARLLEILCCNGCIMGAGMATDAPLYRRRYRVSKFAREILQKRDYSVWLENMRKFEELDLSRTFIVKDQRLPMPNVDELNKILLRLGKFKSEDELNCGACGYETCREHAVAIHKGLAEDEMCLPFVISKLHVAIKDLNLTNDQLSSTREALMQSEKLASMGQLAAGIAHELNNPLGVVLMYANLVLEEYDKNSSTYDDLSIIANEAERCKKIVSGLLNFARKNKVLLMPENICELIDQCLNISHIPDNIKVTIEHELPYLTADIDRNQIIQVMNNLVSNAITAMADGGELFIKTSGDDVNAKISVSDNGCGISEKNLKKIFEPFFTTKQIGQGTGLGLAVTYGIIKMHKGQIDVKSNSDPLKGALGTTFYITLPIRNES